MKFNILPGIVLFFVFSGTLTDFCEAQQLQRVVMANASGLSADQILLSDSSSVIMARGRALYSFRMNGRLFASSAVNAEKEGERYIQNYENILTVTFSITDSLREGWSGNIDFENRSGDTVSVSNVVPFGEDNSSVYITGDGPWDLARARLFRPGFRPLRVILPDNAWELGYCSFFAGYDLSVCALARRTATTGGEKHRYETKLPPGAKVSYSVHATVFSGEWQNGLKIMFRDKYLYDLQSFDNSLYERKDLAWIRGSYIIILQMAWDREFYDRFSGKYNFPDVIRKGTEQFGAVDAYGIWPTWPRLGLDQRNQWDLYRDLPGGTAQLKIFSRLARSAGTRFFIAYNPWDKSTRQEDHVAGLASVIDDTEADGVVLDTMGESQTALQQAADSVRKGVVMYSEGMAVPKDMPGIIAGRVHNAIFLSPELNLNKLIKPDFSIFRVCDVGEDLIHRELAVAFFNGYGTELNLYRPGRRDDNYREDLDYLARTTFILRQNNDVFLDMNWTPLIETTQDNVFVNRWTAGDKIVYTVLNMRPEGYSGRLFRADSARGVHYVSLWNHEMVQVVIEKDKSWLSVHTDGWDTHLSGTRSEGSLDCIAAFPGIIKASLRGDSVAVHPPAGMELAVWKGNPSYKTQNRIFRTSGDTTLRIRDLFGFYEGKIVIQLTENKILRDEDVVYIKGGKPWLISQVKPTERSSSAPSEMVLVPGGTVSMKLTPADEFIPYPETAYPVKVDSFMIDRYPVTNAQYLDFITNTGYRPVDTTRYLRHWQDGSFRQGQDKYPVVYVSYEDMQAYAAWSGKRLPAEAEWQLAAQGTDGRKWPWGNEFHGTLCNNGFDRPTPVDAFPKGQSQCGAADMVGNVWQFTGDIYFNGSDYFAVIRGGSYYKPESSWWYVQGGPQQLDKRQVMLMVAPGFDRCATVGFRCVRDVDSRNFRSGGKDK